MNCYYVGIVYAGSCTIFPYFVLISQLIWPPYTVPVCDWTFKKKNHQVKLTEFCRKHLWKVMYKVSSKKNDR